MYRPLLLLSLIVVIGCEQPKSTQPSAASAEVKLRLSLELLYVEFHVEGLSDLREHLNRGAIAEMNTGLSGLLPNRGADNVCGVDEVRAVVVDVWHENKSHDERSLYCGWPHPSQTVTTSKSSISPVWCGTFSL